MSPRTGSIRKYQNSQSLLGALPSLDSKQNLTLTSVGEVQLSTPPDKRNPPVYVLIRVLISQNQKLGLCKRGCQKVRKQMKVTTGVPDKLDPVKQKEAAEENEEKRLKVMTKQENDAFMYQYLAYCYMMERGEMEAAEGSEEKRLQVKAMLENDQYLYDNIVYCYLKKKREIFILRENGDIYRKEKDMLSMWVS
ncbi:hypothetical protein AVEN_199159-1 [Araneus ventricosus]|uniref:Uncharacterized protein n=1 Tax=Araneus ventricosus TaxID=182803 RepID=A0A4Y2JZ98_ARAVE|nr:hypothetical protein AVEN_199159-1 [Araneus ventricosus]